MTQPLVILLYERILPGTQLLNRFQDLGYRVLSLSHPAELLETVRREKPLLTVVDMHFEGQNVAEVIAALRADSETAHVPIIAIVAAEEKDLQKSATEAGAKLVVSDKAVLVHLNQLLDQALQID